MNDEREDTVASEPAIEPKSGVDLGRRRLGSLGAAGTAVVLSVASRSAVAGWGTCTGSELASGNLSRAGQPNPCGCSPGFWWNQNGTALWTTAPSLYQHYPRTAQFNAVFGVNFYNPDVQLLAVGPGTKNANTISDGHDLDNVGMQAVAALLNAQYYGSRYPVLGLQSAGAVILAFQTAFAGGKSGLKAFVSKVDIYSSTSNLWCNGSPE